MWLREVRRITRERQIPLVLDEIQTGWGRTGKLYAFEHSGIVPDVLVLSKAIGGGLPMAVIVYHEDLDVWKPGAHTGTFRGNQLAMTAGVATLRYLLEHDVPTHAQHMGRQLRARLEKLQPEFPFLGDVRGRGLMVGVEVVDPEQTRFCAGQFHLPGSAHLYREGKGGHHGWMNLVEAIAKS